MEEQARRRVTGILVSLFALAYFFVCAIPLPKVFSLKPIWVSPVISDNLPESSSTAATGPLLPFSIGGSFGYFDTARGLRFASRIPSGVSLSREGYAAYDRVPATIQWRDVQGKLLFETEAAAYPFMAGGRRFTLAADQATVTELDGRGKELWRRTFPSMITAFDSSPTLALFGTLDGHLLGLSREGQILVDFVPGGSRIDCVFGAAVSPDGTTIAAITGLDRQRIVVMERRNESYRVTWHRYTGSDYRRPVAMAFSPAGDILSYELPDGFGLYDVLKRTERQLVARGPSHPGAAIASKGVMLALEEGPKGDLLAFSHEGTRYFSYGFAALEASLEIEGDSVFLGVRQDGGMDLLRLDYGEE
ncbi:MAG: hypothetical protein ACOYM2_19170 [Rectinemataceae bacterium]